MSNLNILIAERENKMKDFIEYLKNGLVELEKVHFYKNEICKLEIQIDIVEFTQSLSSI